MSVLLETSKGDVVVDLYTDECPNASKNFLKLCKIKYYNNCLFHYVVRDFLAQTGDPTGSGKGGDSLNGVLYGEQARFFDDEIRPHIRHRKKGMLGMAGGGKNLNASQFYITTGAELDSLDEKHTIFGEVTEGMDVLMAINDAFVDDSYRPLQNIRIRHTIILEDPCPDPPQLEDHIPESSPPPVFATEGDRLEDDWVPNEDTRDAAIIEEETRKLEAEKRAEVLEMVGDLPAADAKPPTNQIFVCKLNPVTTEEDLEIIFSRFGQVTACDIIRDWKTGDSLCYAFVSFDSDEAAEAAFFKMDNVLIDDRRIHVDFSQSMHHLWRQFKAFGKAGSAALGAEANAKDQKSAERGGRPPDRLEIKPGATRGLYAGPSHAARGGYEMVHEEEMPRPSGRGEQQSGRHRGNDHRGDFQNGHARHTHSRPGERDRSHRHRSRSRERHQEVERRSPGRHRHGERSERSARDSRREEQAGRRNDREHRRESGSREERRHRADDRDKRHKEHKRRHRDED